MYGKLEGNVYFVFMLYVWYLGDFLLYLLSDVQDFGIKGFIGRVVDVVIFDGIIFVNDQFKYWYVFYFGFFGGFGVDQVFVNVKYKFLIGVGLLFFCIGNFFIVWEVGYFFYNLENFVVII